jgi:hypothetical protein
MPTTSGTNFDFARAEALTKYVYADKFEELAPDSDKTAKEFEFVPAAQKLGRKFYQPVEMSRSTGATFNRDGSAFALNRSRAPQELTAEIVGCETLIRETASYAMMTRALEGAAKGGKAGLKAFVQATQSVFNRLAKGGSYFRECNLLYGAGETPTTSSGGLGIVESITTASGTQLTVKLTVASWATAIWAGSEGGAFDIYSPAGVKRNAAGTDEQSVYVLSSAAGGVSPSTYELTFASINANVVAVAPGDVIFFEGARTKECLGVIDAASQTTLWGISTTQYNLWKPRTIPIAGQLSFETVMEATAQLADIGFTGTLNAHVSPAGWKDIMDDQAALVRWQNKSGGKVELGFEEVSYVGQTGRVNIKPNIYIKRGICPIFPEGHCKRVGSTDFTFMMPGFGKMLRELDGVAGVEARTYADQAPFINHPSFYALLTGVTNSSD